MVMPQKRGSRALLAETDDPLKTAVLGPIKSPMGSLSLHVVPNARGGWDVREQNSAGASVSRHQTREQAASRAAHFAQVLGGASIIVHGSAQDQAA
jgi:hypothetical protein